MSSQPVRSFRDLEVWQSAMLVAVLAHKIADLFPAIQRYALGAQVRNAADVDSEHVAEGHAQRGTRNYLRHIRIALGSLAELDSQLELAFRLELIGRPQVDGIASELVRCAQLLHGLQRALGRRMLTMAAAAAIAPVTVAYVIRILY